MTAFLISFPTVIISGFSIYYADEDVLVIGSITVLLIIISGTFNEFYQTCSETKIRIPVTNEERQALLKSMEAIN